jgi:hypothetical protein
MHARAKTTGTRSKPVQPYRNSLTQLERSGAPLKLTPASCCLNRFVTLKTHPELLADDRAKTALKPSDPAQGDHDTAKAQKRGKRRPDPEKAPF